MGKKYGFYDGGLRPSLWGDQRGGQWLKSQSRKRKRGETHTADERQVAEILAGFPNARDISPVARAPRRGGQNKAFLDRIRPSPVQLRAPNGTRNTFGHEKTTPTSAKAERRWTQGFYVLRHSSFGDGGQLWRRIPGRQTVRKDAA